MRVYFYSCGVDMDKEIDAIKTLGHHVVVDEFLASDEYRKEAVSSCDIIICCGYGSPEYIKEWASCFNIEVVGFWEFMVREKATMLKPVAEAVSHPAHYTFGKYEVIDVIEDWGLDFHLGNVIKYVARAGRKGDPKEDLLKAKWYLERAIEKMEKQS